MRSNISQLWFSQHKKLFDEENLKFEEVWAKEEKKMGRIPDHLLVNSHVANIREQTVGKLAGKDEGNGCHSFK